MVTAQAVRQNVFRTDRSVTVVNRRELRERAARTTPEALWDSPGVFVQQTNHGGGSPIIRGLMGPQVLILVDGVRLNNSTYRTGPVQYLNLVDPFSIGRIEVLRGSGSVLYGSDAMGGVIQVFPLGPRSPAGQGLWWGGSVIGRHASAESGRALHGHFELGYGGFGALAGVTYKRNSDLMGGSGVGAQPYSGYEHWSATGQLEYRVRGGWFDGWKVRAGYLLAQILNAGRTDKLYNKHSLNVYDNGNDLVYAQLHLRLRPIRTRGRLIVSYQHFTEIKDTIKLEDDLVTEVETTRDDVLVHTVGVQAQFTTRIAPQLRLQYGGMWYQDHVGAEQLHRLAGEGFTILPQSSYPDGSTYQNWGAYVLLRGTPLATCSGHVLHLTAGYRIHGMRGEAPERPGLPAVDFDHLGHVFQSSVRYLYRDRATVALSFSQGFRAPNLFEAVMLGDSGQFFHIPNDRLGPERSNTLELLARGRFGRLTFGYSIYLTLLQDLIKRETTTWEDRSEIGGKPVTWNVNGGEGRMLGMEAQLQVQLHRGLTLLGHLTYTFGEEEMGDSVDAPLRLVPPLFGGVVLRYRYWLSARLQGFVQTSIRAAGRQARLSPEDEVDSRIPEGGTPGWWTWNLRAGITAVDHLRVVLAAENLLNRKYKYHGSGLWAPGLNIIVMLEAFL